MALPTTWAVGGPLHWGGCGLVRKLQEKVKQLSERPVKYLQLATDWNCETDIAKQNKEGFAQTNCIIPFHSFIFNTLRNMNSRPAVVHAPGVKMRTRSGQLRFCYHVNNTWQRQPHLIAAKKLLKTSHITIHTGAIISTFILQRFTAIPQEQPAFTILSFAIKKLLTSGLILLATLF